ncbi:MAG TPA: 6,7-dimethyl-8-ribityllumazine synthase [Rubrobacter sp.]|nr:6,7-dimethyl-8-ribityllumazine synthase [Rubrobacter sp.]
MEGVNHIEGNLSAEGKSFGIVASRFNDFVVKALLEGAIEAIRRHGGVAEAVDVVWVPGSLEIPVVARELALSGRYDALICLGAVIRGATAHFDYVAGGAAGGISNVGLETGVPVIFGVITTESIEQAIERAGTKMGNKGFEAAVSAMEMADLMAKLRARASQDDTSTTLHNP